MRVEDVLSLEIDTRGPGRGLRTDGDTAYSTKGNAAHSEVVELRANMLFNCLSLARDEIELANLILSKLDVNPHYFPSKTLLGAIRGINDKLSGDSSCTV